MAQTTVRFCGNLVGFSVVSTTANEGGRRERRTGSKQQSGS